MVPRRSGDGAVGGVFLGEDRAVQLARNIHQGAKSGTLTAAWAPRAVEECLKLKIAVKFFSEFHLNVVE